MWTTSSLRFNLEPAVFAYSFAIVLYSSVLDELILEKTCSPDGQPQTGFICTDTNHQAEITYVISLRTTMREVLPVMALLVAGSWRDRTGLSKPLMYISLMGGTVGVLFDSMTAWRWLMPVRITSVTGALFLGLGGGSKFFYFGAICTLTSLYRPEERTARLTSNLGAGIAGSTLARVLSSYSIEYIGFCWSFFFINGVFMTTLWLISFVSEGSGEPEECASLSLRDRLKTVFMSRPNGELVWTMYVCSSLIYATTKADMNMLSEYLYAGFDFTQEQNNYYSNYLLLISATSALILPKLLSNFLKENDLQIGIIAGVASAITCCVLAISRTKVELLIVPFLDSTKIFLFTIPISVIARYVRRNEIGIYLSVCFVAQTFFPMALTYLYEVIFSVTWNNFPGAYYFISASVAALLGVLYRVAISRRTSSDNESEQIANNCMENCKGCKKKIKY